jgi:hypothetical protein
VFALIDIYIEVLIEWVKIILEALPGDFIDHIAAAYAK